MDKEIIYLLIYLLWNALVFLIYGFDKRQAKKQQFRISEFNLLVYALVFGGVGALAGMLVFRHKTKKRKFQIFIPIAILLNAIVLGYYLKIR